PSAPTSVTVNGPARSPSTRGISVPFVTTTVHVPSAQARSWAGVEGFIGFAGVGDGSGEDRVGAGEADDGSAEREGAPEAAAFAPSSSEPQPVSAAART